MTPVLQDADDPADREGTHGKAGVDLGHAKKQCARQSPTGHNLVSKTRSFQQGAGVLPA
jgi:hypothetical protein